MLGSKQYKPKEDDKSRWGRLQFTLFSMFVSSSFFAAYSVGTFYTVFLFGLGPTIRYTFFIWTWQGFLYEITDARVMIKLFEGCYMYRHEQDLYREEETYRMIQEIVRSPGLLKILTGSSLRGTLDPKLDDLKRQVRKKLQRLEILEQKGFDVEEVRDKILRKQMDDQIDAMVDKKANEKAK